MAMPDSLCGFCAQNSRLRACPLSRRKRFQDDGNWSVSQEEVVSVTAARYA